MSSCQDSGIHVDAGSDAAAVSVFDPWLEIYYTSENGWFLKEEDKLGTIEAGKLGDLVVLNDDYFDKAKVSDEGIKKLKSVLTVVDGKVVYDKMQ